MAVMKELAVASRVCAKHGAFYQDFEFFASELFEDCPFCEEEASKRQDFETSTRQLEWAAEELSDFAKSRATAIEAPALAQALALIRHCLTARRSAPTA